MTFIQTIPPPSPKGLIGSIGVLVLLAGVVLIAAYCNGCGAPAEPQLPKYCYSQKEFGEKLKVCVDAAAARASTEADFRADSSACRQTVHRNCGIVMTITNRAEVSP